MAFGGLRRWVAGAVLAAALATSSAWVFAAQARADTPSCPSSNNTHSAATTCVPTSAQAPLPLTVGAPSEGSLTDSRGNFGGSRHH
jgi:hypothetical protein